MKILSKKLVKVTFDFKHSKLAFYKLNTSTPYGAVKCTELENSKKILTNHRKSIYRIVFLKNETIFATASDDSTIEIWDNISAKRIARLSGHTDRIWDMIKLTNGKLATCSSDKSIRIWNVETKK